LDAEDYDADEEEDPAQRHPKDEQEGTPNTTQEQENNALASNLPLRRCH